MLRPLHNRRPAFTLIELLVVIAIIAILASLLIGGVMMIMGRGTDARDVNDIKQLDIAINSFKADKKCYPPSRIVLYASYADYFKNLNSDPQLDSDSLQAINRIWPNIGAFAYINWASTTNAAGFPPNGVILEGDQCLVFFLGGVYDPGQSGMMGFSTNPKNPAMDNAVGERKRYYDFPAGRLNTTRTANHANFPSYNDNYTTGVDPTQQRPFIYFAAALAGSTTPNTYNAKHAITITYSDGLLPASDLISPYYSSVTKKYWNPTTFQIITAGRDGRYGALGEWNDGASPVADKTWKDNRANWSSYVLGAQAQ